LRRHAPLAPRSGHTRQRRVKLRGLAMGSRVGLEADMGTDKVVVFSLLRTGMEIVDLPYCRARAHGCAAGAQEQGP
jgi:hypothetical protein